MDGRVVSQGVLIVSAVREDGMREILAVEVADTESEATYQELFRSLKRAGAQGGGVGGLGRPRGPQGGRLPPLPGSISAEVPGPLREEPPRDGGPRQAQGARGGPAGDLRRAEQGAGPPDRIRAWPMKWREQGQREGRRAPRRAHRGMPHLPGLPREPPQAHPHDQRPGTAQPGDKAAHEGGEDLPQPRVVPAPGDGFGGGAYRRSGLRAGATWTWRSCVSTDAWKSSASLRR